MVSAYAHTSSTSASSSKKRSHPTDCGISLEDDHLTSKRQKTTPVDEPPFKASSPKKVVEKRGAVFKKKCPQNITERMERVMSQRFYMVDRRRVPGELEEEFSVLGSTGNCYTITIGRKPTCDCPDADRGNHCKHIIFVFLKVLQVPLSSGHWYQKALLTNELQEVFDNAPLTPGSASDPRVSAAYAQATGKDSPSKENKESKRRVPGPDDDCPICYESMNGVSEDSLAFCEICGNALHRDCFKQWSASSKKSGKDLTCVWCRARWLGSTDAGSSSSGSQATMRKGYLNLAEAAGLSTVRGTSTYYNDDIFGHRSSRNASDRWKGGYRKRRYW